MAGVHGVPEWCSVLECLQGDTSGMDVGATADISGHDHLAEGGEHRLGVWLYEAVVVEALV